MNNVFYHVVQFGEWEPIDHGGFDTLVEAIQHLQSLQPTAPDDEFAVIRYSQTIAYTTREGDLE